MTDYPAHASPALLRLSQIIGPGNPIPVSKSTWWQGVKDGRFPKPLKLGPRVTVWREEDVRALVEKGVS
ncbi:MAG: AlpA family phage regulatory protein [Pseudomonadota bacterium]